MTSKDVLLKHGIAHPVCGFHIRDTWLPVVDRAFARMIVAGWDRDLHQVKEKFHGLRIYIGSTTDALDDIIRDAERECAAIDD